MKKIYKLSKLPLWCVVLFGCGEVGGSVNDFAKMKQSLKNAEEKIDGLEDDVLALKRGQNKIPLQIVQQQIDQQTKKIDFLPKELEQAKQALLEAFKKNQKTLTDSQTALLGDIQRDIQTKFDALQAEVGKKASADDIQTKLDALKNDVTNLGIQLGGINGQFNNLANTLNSLNTKLGAHANSVNTLGGVLNFGQRFVDVENKVNESKDLLARLDIFIRALQNNEKK